MPTNINWNQVINNGVKLARVSNVDANGNNISNYLNTIQSFTIPWPAANGGPIEYIIIDRQPQLTSYLFFIYPQPLSPADTTFTYNSPILFDPGTSQTYYAPSSNGTSTISYNIPFTNGDYDTLINNVSTPQYSAKYMDIDYTVGITTPYNFELLISGTADRAPVQDTNYSSKAWTNIRYNGSRQSSRDFNVPY